VADLPPDLYNASPEDLKELVQSLLERVNVLERENARLCRTFYLQNTLTA
jgi:hypothetical protein